MSEREQPKEGGGVYWTAGLHKDKKSWPKFKKLTGVDEWLRVWRLRNGELHIELLAASANEDPDVFDEADFNKHGPWITQLPPEGWGKLLAEIAIAIAPTIAEDHAGMNAAAAQKAIARGWNKKISSKKKIGSKKKKCK